MDVDGEDMLPDGWEVVSLGAIVESQYGTSAPSCDDGNVANIGMKNIVDGKLDLKDVVSSKLNDAEIDEYELRPGDILFNRTNSFDLVGKTAVFEGGQRGRYVRWTPLFGQKTADP